MTYISDKLLNPDIITQVNNYTGWGLTHGFLIISPYHYKPKIAILFHRLEITKKKSSILTELIKFYDTYDKTIQAKTRILLRQYASINNATNMSENQNKKKSNIILNTVQNFFHNHSLCFQLLSDYKKSTFPYSMYLCSSDHGV